MATRSDFVALERNLTARLDIKMLKLSAKLGTEAVALSAIRFASMAVQYAGRDVGAVPALNIAIVSKLFMHRK